ncbi:MAG: hypothetical protein GXY42_01875 [Desulfovibrionales bacterium]|nr:hypothetical protein [Desulfovibrionales bacterium]
MNAKSLETKILAPGYGIIVAGSVFENLVLHTNWFKLGGLFGAVWLCAGLVCLVFSRRELNKGQGYMLVESGLFSFSRNPATAAHLLGVMPGLCLLLNTNIGILGIIYSLVLFFKHISAEELELEDRFGEAYVAYRERVNRLIPGVF